MKRAETALGDRGNRGYWAMRVKIFGSIRGLLYPPRKGGHQKPPNPRPKNQDPKSGSSQVKSGWPLLKSHKSQIPLGSSCAARDQTRLYSSSRIQDNNHPLTRSQKTTKPVLCLLLVYAPKKLEALNHEIRFSECLFLCTSNLKPE